MSIRTGINEFNRRRIVHRCLRVDCPEHGVADLLATVPVVTLTLAVRGPHCCR